jgi:nucleotide-binding universal stress UspA family protein
MERIALDTSLGKLLGWCAKQHATDIHAQAARRYSYRVDGRLLRIAPETFPVPGNDDIHQMLRQSFSAAIATINPGQVRAILTRPELMSCAQIIQACKNESADLIIVGENYRQKPGSFFHGSLLEKLVHQSPCPVMIVPSQVDPIRLKGQIQKGPT